MHVSFVFTHFSTEFYAHQQAYSSDLLYPLNNSQREKKNSQSQIVNSTWRSSKDYSIAHWRVPEKPAEWPWILLTCHPMAPFAMCCTNDIQCTKSGQSPRPVARCAALWSNRRPGPAQSCTAPPRRTSESILRLLLKINRLN